MSGKYEAATAAHRVWRGVVLLDLQNQAICKIFNFLTNVLSNKLVNKL